VIGPIRLVSRYLLAPLWLGAAVAASIVTLSAAPASAESAPHWYENGKLIVGSVSVQARGSMRFEPPTNRPDLPVIRCSDVVADWTLSNPSSGEAGTGELISLTASGCKARPRCSGTSASIGGIPKRASLTREESKITELFKSTNWRAECSAGGFEEGEELFVVITRRGVIKMSSVSSNAYHPGFAAGKLALPNNITAH
jgi:hypothetical protein